MKLWFWDHFHSPNKTQFSGFDDQWPRGMSPHQCRGPPPASHVAPLPAGVDAAFLTAAGGGRARDRQTVGPTTTVVEPSPDIECGPHNHFRLLVTLCNYKTTKLPQIFLTLPPLSLSLPLVDFANSALCFFSCFQYTLNSLSLFLFLSPQSFSHLCSIETEQSSCFFNISKDDQPKCGGGFRCKIRNHTGGGVGVHHGGAKTAGGSRHLLHHFKEETPPKSGHQQQRQNQRLGWFNEGFFPHPHQVSAASLRWLDGKPPPPPPFSSLFFTYIHASCIYKG